MIDQVRCPACGVEFEVTTAMREQLAKEIRAAVTSEADARIARALAEKEAELGEARARMAAADVRERELLAEKGRLAERERANAVEMERRIAEATAAKVAELAASEAALRASEHALATRERALAADHERRLAAQAEAIRDEEKKTGEARAARAIADALRAKDEETAELRSKLDAAHEKELDLLRKGRELEERERTMALEVERRLVEERTAIRAQEAERAQERAELERGQQRLRDEQHQVQIASMQRTIAELHQKMQQGSQQTQGEAQEVLLREILARAFDDDLVEDVPKGVNGGDVVQRVRTPDGREAGMILWESKRTKSWSDEWLKKVREDQRAAGAACAVIVSQALPAGFGPFGLRNGVWVCAWPLAVAVATAMRVAVLDVARVERAAEGRGDKMQCVYEYLTGTEFRHCVEGVVEAFSELQADFEGEKKWIATRWRKREKQLQRAAGNIMAIWGDLQGIAGSSLRDLPALGAPTRALPAGGSDDGDPTP